MARFGALQRSVGLCGALWSVLRLDYALLRSPTLSYAFLGSVVRFESSITLSYALLCSVALYGALWYVLRLFYALHRSLTLFYASLRSLRLCGAF